MVTITYFNMLTDIDKQLMLKFLTRNYPVSRIKHNMRFKRAIIFDDGSIYLLSDDSKHQLIKYKLLDTIKKVFACDDAFSKDVLNNFLPLR